MTATSRRRGPSERDHAVLRLLHQFRLLAGPQLQRLVIAEGSELTRARRTRGTLKRLYDRQLVTRLAYRRDRVRAGADSYIYQLTGRGFGVLTRLDGTPAHKLSGQPGERFVDHVLAVSELYVQLVEAERSDQQRQVMIFEAEPRSWRSYQSPDGGRLVIRPDAFAHTKTYGRGFVHFVEVDRATEALPTIHTKCLNYIDYWHSGQEERRLGAFPRVLWVVPSAQRAQQITGIIRKLPPEAQPLFAVATDSEAPAALFGEWVDQAEPP